MTPRAPLFLAAALVACASSPAGDDPDTSGAPDTDTDAATTTESTTATESTGDADPTTESGETSTSDTDEIPDGPIDFAFSWSADDDPAANAQLSKVAMTPTGDVVLAGATGAWADGRHAVFMSFAPDGALRWAFSWAMETASHETVTDLAVAPDGTIHAVGFTDAGGFGSNDALVLAIDDGGDVVWARSWGGTYADVANGIAIDDGQIVVVGWSDPDADVCNDSPPECSRNGMALTLSATGDIERTVSWLGGTRTDATAVAIDDAGDLWVTGLLALDGGQNGGGLWRIDGDGEVTTVHGWAWSQRDAAPSEVFVGPDGDAFVVDHPHTFDGGDDPQHLVVVHVGESMWSTDHALGDELLYGRGLGLAGDRLVALASTGTGSVIAELDPAAGAVSGAGRIALGEHRAGTLLANGRALVVARGDSAPTWDEVALQSVVNEETAYDFEPPVPSALARGSELSSGMRTDIADAVLLGAAPGATRVFTSE